MPILDEALLSQHGDLTVSQFLQRLCDAQVGYAASPLIAHPISAAALPSHQSTCTLVQQGYVQPCIPLRCDSLLLPCVSAVRVQCALVRRHAASLVEELKEKAGAAEQRLTSSAQTH